MATRHIRTPKEERVQDICGDAFIERLRKMRALNCKPADIGIDNYVWKKLSFGVTHYVTKY